MAPWPPLATPLLTVADHDMGFTDKKRDKKRISVAEYRKIG